MTVKCTQFFLYSFTTVLVLSFNIWRSESQVLIILHNDAEISTILHLHYLEIKTSNKHGISLLRHWYPQCLPTLFVHYVGYTHGGRHFHEVGCDAAIQPYKTFWLKYVSKQSHHGDRLLVWYPRCYHWNQGVRLVNETIYRLNTFTTSFLLLI